MVETCLKLLPSIEAVTGRGAGPRGPGAACRGCQCRWTSLRWRGVGPPTRAQSPREGWATSSSLRVGTALASVDQRHATEGTSIDIDIRGTPHPGRVVRLPFL